MKKTNDPTVALIDADLLVYTLAAAFTKEFSFEDPDEPPCVSSDYKGAYDKIERWHRETQAILSADVMLYCFSCPSEDNFRYHLHPDYKHNRRGQPKPALFGLLKDHLEATRDTVIAEGCEADDLLGVLSGPHTVVCSFDKDLHQIAGRHYDWRDQTFTEVTEEEAELFFWTQCLTGDPTDGYHGVPRVGPKTAAKLLDEVYCEKDAWSVIKQAYGNKDISEEDALVQCRLARILRPGELDQETGEVLLWVPNGAYEVHVRPK